MFGRTLGTMTMLAGLTLASCTSLPRPEIRAENLEERIIETRLAENQDSVRYVEDIFPPHPGIMNITTRALRSVGNIERLSGGSISEYMGVMGEFKKQMDASLGSPTLVYFGATWCPPCPSKYEELVAFAEQNPDTRVLFVVIDESRRELAGHDVYPSFQMLYGFNGFSTFLPFDEAGELIGDPTPKLPEAAKVLDERDVPENSAELYRRGWFNRAKIAYEDRGGVPFHIRPAIFINQNRHDAVTLLDERSYKTGNLELYAWPNGKLIQLIEEETGMPFPELDSDLDKVLWQYRTVDFIAEDATPEEIAQHMVDFYDGQATLYERLGREDIAGTYREFGTVMRGYHAMLPKGGRTFSVRPGSCVTMDPPESVACDYEVVTVADWFDVFEDLTGIEVVYRDLSPPYGDVSSLNATGEIFDLVKYQLLRDDTSTVIMEGDPMLRDGPARIAVTASPDYTPESD